ncbi:DMT family transporter [Mycobacterium sp. BMJ-28]
MWGILGSAILVEVLATLAMRASNGLRIRKWIPVAIAGYAVSFLLLWVSLWHGIPVGIAYGIWTACGVALVAVVARVLFQEPLTWVMSIGMVFIVAGVLTIAFSAH